MKRLVALFVLGHLLATGTLAFAAPAEPELNEPPYRTADNYIRVNVFTSTVNCSVVIDPKTGQATIGYGNAITESVPMDRSTASESSLQIRPTCKTAAHLSDIRDALRKRVASSEDGQNRTAVQGTLLKVGSLLQQLDAPDRQPSS